MESKVLDSIVEITNQRDSNALGISVLVTISDLLPDCFITLYQSSNNLSKKLSVLHTLSAESDDDGIKKQLWEQPVPLAYEKFVRDNTQTLIKLTIYQTDDVQHVFIPIIVDNKVIYALDVASATRLSKYVGTLVTIAKACENFYAVLAASERDALTGLLNRRTYDVKLSTLLTMQNQKQIINQRDAGNVRKIDDVDHTWLAMIDIDFFKRVNDQFGHIYGDEVLLVLSQMMARLFRDNDLLFRFGGEEFIVIFEPINKEKAELALNKFMNAVRKQRFPMVGNITISIGYARISMNDHPTNVLDNADKALYFAKENGRNRLCNFEELVEQGELSVEQCEGDIELF